LQGIPCPKEKRKGKKKGTPNLGKKVGSWKIRLSHGKWKK
jgi:hypothetical protein